MTIHSGMIVSDYWQVLSGDIAISTTVNTGGNMRVSSGGSATSTTVNSGGYIGVYGDGFAVSTTVNNDGGMWVSSGGTATSTTVNSNGKIWVSSGGSATSTTVNSGGAINGFVVREDTHYASKIHISNTYVTTYANLYADQTAISTIVSSGGTMWISWRGIATSTTVNNAGQMRVSWGGSATSTTVNFSGAIMVYNGGSAISTTVNSGGAIMVYNGGSAISTTVNSGGAINGFIVREDTYYASKIHISNTYVTTSANLYAGQTATSTIVSAGGAMWVERGGEAALTTVSSGGKINGFVVQQTNYYSSGIHVSDAYVTDFAFLYSGQTARGIMVNSGGSMLVEFGGTALSTTVNSSGFIWVSSGGSARATTVNFRGVLRGDGATMGTTVNSGGTMWIGDDGKAISTTLSSSGMLGVAGSATETTVNGGTMSIWLGGSVTSTAVNSGGRMEVARGRAMSTMVNSGGAVIVSSGGSATGTTVNSGGTVMVSSGGLATGTTVNSGGTAMVSSGGLATGTTVNSGGAVVVSSGGSATGTTINSGGAVMVSGGGSATGTTVNSGGSINGFIVQQGNYYSSEIYVSDTYVVTSANLYAGQTATSTRVSSGGNMTVSSGGSATETIVSSGGNMTVSSGGSAMETTVSSGGSINGFIVQQDNYYSSGIHVSDTYVATSANLYIDQTATSTMISANGYLDVSYGGVATLTTVHLGGVVRISSGGSAISTTVSSGGSMSISRGGVASSTLVNPGGVLCISSGGTASIIFSPWSRGYVSSAYGAKVTYLERDANVYWGNNNTGIIGKGNFAEDIIISSGVSMLLYSKGRANATTVSSGGLMSVFSGGVATMTILNNGGMLSVTLSGIVSSTSVNSGGSMSVFLGGVARETTVNSNGEFSVSSGGVATMTVVNPDGVVRITSGGTASIAFSPWSRGYVSSAYGAKVTYLERDANVYWGNNNTGIIGKGNSAENIIISSGTSMLLYSSGTVSAITINPGGYLKVSNGGKANLTTVSSGGNINGFIILEDNYYSTGIHVSNAYVISSAELYAGQTATSTAVSFGGWMSVFSGGIANATTLSGGEMYISSGGAASSTLVNPGGALYVSSGGTASIAFSPWSRGYVSSAYGAKVTYLERDTNVYWGNDNFGVIGKGNFAGDIIISSGVSMLLYSKGMANATTVSSGGSMSVSNGGTATATTVNSGGNINGFLVQEDNYYSSGIHVSNAVVAADSSAYLYSDQTATLTRISSNGELWIYDGAKITSTMVTAGAHINGFYVQEDNYYANGIQVSNASVIGNAFLYDGQRAISTIICSGGVISVSSGAATISTIICSGGVMSVFSGGIASSPLVNPGGTLYVSSGGTASIAFSPWSRGYVSSAYGAKVTYLERDTNVYWGNDNFGVIGKENFAEGIIISSGVSMLLYSKGKANATTVSSGGSMSVSCGGETTSTTISSGGSINGFLVQEDNYYSVGIHVSNASVTASANLYSDQTALSTTVNSGGEMFISSGGLATSTTVNSGGEMFILSGGLATSTTVNSGGEMFILSEGLATSTTVNSGGEMFISSGGLATSTTVNEHGIISVFSGGTANNTTVNGHGTMSVFSGGSASGLLLESNGSLQLHNALAENVTIAQGGSAYISGGTIRNLTLTSRGAVAVSNAEINGVDVHSSGRLNCVSHQEGRMVISGAIIRSDGQITMSSGTSISGAIVSKAGTLNLENGGSAYQTALDEEGKFTMLGVAHHTVLNGGSMFVGDSAYRDYDGTGGMPTSNVYTEDIHASVNILNSSWLHIYSGGTATSNMISSNSWAHVYWGGTATSNVINSSGYLTVQDSGTADTTLLHSGGYMRLYAGAILKGQTNVGGKVTVTRAGTSATEDVIRAYGAKINFLVSERMASDESIVTDLGMIMGATYFVTVSSIQQSGTYRLADGAKDFTGSITVMNTTGNTLGSLTVNGTLSAGNYQYTLNKSEGTLSLTVERTGAPIESPLKTQTGRFSATGGAVQLFDTGKVILHTSAAIREIGSINTSAWTLLDSGDFNRDGKDGLLWLEKATGNVYMQDDLSSMAEVTNKSKLLGIAGDGYEVQAAGDFFGTGFDGALLLSPAFGDSTVSLNYGLATWSREQDGSTTPGWLGALVNTWEESGALNSLKGDFQNLTGDARNEVINKNNYRYEFVGVGDFNGDGKDDVMLRNTMPDVVGGETITGAGDVFVFLTDTRENVIAGNRPAEGIVYTGCATDGWDVVGFGDFNGDGIDDVVISNGTDLAGWQVSNGQRTEDLWFGSLTDGWKFAGVGDFDADGTDDILLADPDNNLAAWKVKDGQTAGTIAIA